MNRKIKNYAALLTQPPHALAQIMGSTAYSLIRGTVRFYQMRSGVLIATEVSGLPYANGVCRNPVYGFHIHSGGRCEGNMNDPFADTMSHYNPEDCAHPFHAGDMPPLFGNHGYAFSVFVTDRFSLAEVIGKTVIIHGSPDDFTTQPSGNSGEKLACGVITACRNRLA